MTRDQRRRAALHALLMHRLRRKDAEIMGLIGGGDPDPVLRAIGEKERIARLADSVREGVERSMAGPGVRDAPWAQAWRRLAAGQERARRGRDGRMLSALEALGRDVRRRVFGIRARRAKLRGYNLGDLSGRPAGR